MMTMLAAVILMHFGFGGAVSADQPPASADQTPSSVDQAPSSADQAQPSPTAVVDDAKAAARAGTDFAHRILLQGKKGLALVEPDGQVSWEMNCGGTHDLHVLENGHILTRRGRASVVEIDPQTRQVVWSYDSSRANGNAGKPVEVHAFEELENGHIMIAESGPARIIEVDRDGTIHHEIPLTVNRPDKHRDTRLVRKLAGGNYLVAHEGDGMVREYDDQGRVVWDFQVPLFGKKRARGHGLNAFGNQLYSAIRLENGNTLIGTGNGHSVLEVTPEKQIVWHLQQDDLPNIRLAWVTTLQVLDTGNYLIGNCHAGPGQPLLVEIEPRSKRVVWTLDRFSDFGNDVTNSVLLDGIAISR